MSGSINIETASAAKAFLRARDSGRFCFERRANKPGAFPGMLTLLGGKMDPDETPLIALRRELREEVQVASRSVWHLTDVEEVVDYTDGRKQKVGITAVFLVKVTKEAAATPTKEIAGIEWLTLNEALNAKPAPMIKEFIINHRSHLETL